MKQICGESKFICIEDEGSSGQYYVVCDITVGGCGSSGRYEYSKRDAIKAWNRRIEHE